MWHGIRTATRGEDSKNNKENLTSDVVQQMINLPAPRQANIPGTQELVPCSSCAVLLSAGINLGGGNLRMFIG